ncbi:hypothetical protein [Thalassobaculum sp.]|uniref:hypothetical protein n=1 Tax=Thalassobaculum sp. TaxID=2022740 RepID=UPI0032EE1BE4
MPPEIAEALALAAPGWPTATADDGIRVARTSHGFRVSDDGADRLADDAWEAAHWVLAAAIGRTAEAAPGRFVLNAGAALTADGAVVFAGESHAGKSSVALHLAVGPVPMLGDDRLILDTAAAAPTAAALGLARKVRTPLPDDFSDAARRLAATTRAGHAAGADVLRWDPAIDRPAGTAAPVARILLLRRDPGIDTARISGLGAAEAVAALLALCGRHAGPAAALLDAVAGLVRQVPVHRLEARDSAAAALALAAAGAPAGAAGR